MAKGLVKKGDFVIVETARGVEFGTVVGGLKEISDDSINQPLKPVIRLATEKDKKQEEEKPLSAENMPVYVQKKEDDSYVIVDQIDNLPNHCANCCHPVPGDEIVTFTTRGYGLAIHRADCPNYLRDLKSGDPERIGRWNKAKWPASSVSPDPENP